MISSYDADRNHGPCLRRGHGAHWAVIFGFLIKTNEFSLESTPKYHLKGNVYQLDCSLKCSLQNISKQDIYLFAKQGKSKRVAIWNYSKLEESNLNLMEVDPKRNNENEYVLPVDRKLTNLCGKIVVLGN